MERYPENERLSRTRIDIVLTFVLAELDLPNNPPAQDLNIQQETYLSWELLFGSQRLEIHGFADYTLHYGAPEYSESNLLVVEAKSRDDLSGGQAQLLAYMCEYHLLHFSVFDRLTNLYSDGRESSPSRREGEACHVRSPD